MADQERVLVKHSVTGRMLINSAVDQVQYQIAYQGNGAIFFIYGVPSEKATQIINLRQELNLFRFEEPEEGPTVKHWFYVQEDNVTYDEVSKCLRIDAESSITYYPDDYWA